MRGRHRGIYAGMMLIVICLGLASRTYSDKLPYFISKYSGDMLWALMVFIGIGLIFSTADTKYIATSAIAFSSLIELSQLYQTSWINNIRAMRLGGLVLGHGFLWSDLVCYFIGIMSGVLTEKCLLYGGEHKKGMHKVRS